MRVYMCDACGEMIQDPHQSEMKEFFEAAEFTEHGVFPRNSTRKIKIHLCDECFKGLRYITDIVAQREEQEQPEEEEAEEIEAEPTIKFEPSSLSLGGLTFNFNPFTRKYEVRKATEGEND